MSNIFRILFCSSLLLLSLTAKTQSSDWSPTAHYPSFSDVQIRILDNYGDSVWGVYHAARTPKGWIIIIEDYDKTVYEEIVLWSADSGWVYEAWPKLKLEPLNQGAQKYYIDALKIQPYYGYPGWDWDVINALRDRPNLPDSGLYALARAYANYQQGLVRPQFGDHTPNEYAEAGYEQIDETRLRQYLSYADTTLMVYRNLESSNPGFMTVVGTVGIKCDNEIVNTAFMLESLRRPDLAESYYNREIYPPALISTAKNFLGECPENAILFTNGDNDTYPLWYVQRKFKFRTDVSVVNTSLLNTPWYIEMIRDASLASQTKVLMSIPDSAWRGHSLDYGFIPTVKDQHYEPLMQLIWHYMMRGNTTPIIGDCEVELTDPDGASLEWVLKGSYLTKGQFAMLDLLAKNFGSRPICFTTTTSSSLFLGLDDWLRYDGMIYTLSPSKSGFDYSGPGKTSIDILYSNLTEKLVSEGYDQLNDQNSRFSAVTNVKAAFGNLAYLLGNFKDKEKLDKAELKYRSVFPLSNHSYSLTDLAFAQAWYVAGDQAKGHQRLTEAGEGILKEMKECLSTPANSPKVHEMAKRIEVLTETMEYAIQIAEDRQEQEMAVRWRTEMDRMKH